ncbi:MAG TPA: HIT domain-containing protein [Xanthomonadaceae bacterium]|jgi:diadenosine tetraphosphate (Ap4A) HIT family hydrolase|nr:HIT domain-containing protein [Xanthomonadaceae bacterium]
MATAASSELEQGWALHPRLVADTAGIGPSELSAIRLMNDARFPWLILVPRRAKLHEFVDLQENEQSLLLEEIRRCCALFKALHTPMRINIAMIGNVVPQLHVHVVARFADDATWPRPVWGFGKAQPYKQEMLDMRVARYRQFFGF